MKKILVIEDDLAVREGLLDLLDAEKYQAFGAGDGKTGVELAKAHLPDLIICDVMMPQLDGFGVLTALQEEPSTATIPFIFLTAKTDKNDLRQGMSLGADDYLTKPFTRAELLGAISARLGKKAVIEEQQAQKLDQLRTSITLSLPIELRSPLNNILGFSQLLIEESDSLKGPEIKEMSEIIYNAGERLHRLIENFLLYAELEVVAANPERIKALRSSRVSSVVSVIEKTALDRAQKAGREADLQLELQDSSLQISKARLEKIVEELLDNAFKYSEADTPVRIVASPVDTELPRSSGNGNSYAEPSALRYALSITDHGRGMSAAQITQIGAYQQFERKLYEQQGSGLGLTIIKRLVQLLYGELTIESIPNQQTTVRVILPI